MPCKLLGKKRKIKLGMGPCVVECFLYDAIALVSLLKKHYVDLAIKYMKWRELPVHTIQL